jgi:PIN domain nuclease of toxin-antitoxin system
MRLLLDTHAFLWFIMGDGRLSSTARSAIETPDDEKLLSAGSLWEIAIKVSLGKLTLAEPFSQIIPRELVRNGFQVLPLNVAHPSVVAALPFHHRDPFDRLLFAQAQVESLPVVTSDSNFDAYGIKRIW